ncbi:MAG: glycosyltransferase [Spirochaetes bacterium]|nr:glycosyltransferase [Spirochaetota bacterium]
MNILIIGEKYFAQKIKNSLEKFDKNNKYYFTNTYKNPLGIIKYFFLLLKSNLLISIKGYIRKKNEIEIAFLFRKKIIFFWIGSDVLDAIKVFNINRISKKYIEKPYHFCEVEWIRDELKKVGVEAKILNFVSIKMPKIFLKNDYVNLGQGQNIDSLITKSYDLLNKAYCENKTHFIILSYINKNRPEFYGLTKIINIASDLTNFEKQNNSKVKIKFIITGITENETIRYYKKNNKLINIPENIFFKGYINSMEQEYLNSHLFLRLIEHDGLSTSVLEALSYGKHIIYTYNFPYIYGVKEIDPIKEKIIELYHKFLNNELKANIEGIKFVLSNYIEDITNKKILEIIKKIT